MASIVELRQHKRYFAVNGAYAVLSPSGLTQGQIIDVGMGGLSFYYFAPGWRLTEVSTLDIYLVTDGFCVKRLPCKNISDLIIRDKSRDYPMVVRRRGIQFGSLTREKQSQLEQFIAHHTRQERGKRSEQSSTLQ